MKKIRNDNRGFSLVELLITIVILGIVVIPLINTFGNSARVNQKSQTVHSAATLGQSVVEEIKSNDVNEYFLSSVFPSITGMELSDLDDATGMSASQIQAAGYTTYFYDLSPSAPTPAEAKVLLHNPDAYKKLVMVKTGLTATDGRSYDIRVVLDPSPYNVIGGTDASQTNVADLPELKSIDSSKGAVIASEINRFDKTTSANPMEVIMYEKLGGNYTEAQLNSLGITLGNMSDKISKEIDFVYDGLTSYTVGSDVYYSMDVTCKVIYTYTNSALSPSTYTEEVLVYQGTYNYTPDTTGTTEAVLDTHIFWKPSCYHDDTVKIINDTNEWLNICFVRQEESAGYYDESGSWTIKTSALSGTEFIPTSTAHQGGRLEETDAKVHFVTNMGKSGSEYSKIYDNKSLLRCYEVTVDMFEANGTDVYDLTATPLTEVVSTKEVYK